MHHERFHAAGGRWQRSDLQNMEWPSQLKNTLILVSNLIKYKDYRKNKQITEYRAYNSCIFPGFFYILYGCTGD